MSLRRAVLGNAAWNWAGMAVNMAAGFATAPFLVRRLGETNYGLWIVLASFTSYFGMLDLGVRGAVGRQVAFRRAQGDRAGVNATLSTALAILGAAGLLALLGSAGASVAITRLLEVPPDQVGAARLSLLLIGVNLALWLPLNVFDATLWAYQRFDLLNIIDVVAVAARTALTFALIGRGHGIVTLAWLNLITQAGAQAAKGAVSFWLDPTLRATLGGIGRAAARELMGFGVWSFLISVSRTLTTQASPLVIGARLGIGLVTPFSVATRLVGYAGALIVAGSGVLTPVATAMHAEGGLDRQRRLMVHGGRACLSLSLYFVGLFALLGRPLIAAWMGPALATSSAPLLTILALGEALPMSQWITHGIILGMGRHRPLALANLAECAAAVALAFGLAGPYGLAGVCVAFALPATLARGVFQLAYGCKLLGLSVGGYCRSVLPAGLGVALFPSLALWLGTTLAPPRSAGWLLLHGSFYTAVFGLAALRVLVGPGQIAGLRRRLTGAGAR